MLAIFDVLEDLQRESGFQKVDNSNNSKHELSCETWLTFCSSIRSKHLIKPKDALTLYMLECPQLEDITKLQFFRLCGALASKPKFKKGQSSFTNLTLLDSVQSAAAAQTAAIEFISVKVSNPIVAEALAGDLPSRQSIAAELHERISSVHNRMSPAVDNVSDKDAEMSMLDVHKGLKTAYMQLRGWIKKAIKFSLTEVQRRWMVESSDFLAHFGVKIEFKGSFIGETLAFCGVQTRLKFKPFSFLGLGMHGLLIYEMVEISSRVAPHSSLIVCWFLLLFFAFENLVYYLAGSEDAHVTLQDSFVNVLVFSAMCFMHVDSHGVIQNQTALTLFIVFQSLRSLKLFAILKGATALYSIGAILLRAFMLIGFVVYFFAIFGHCFFCGAFSASLASKATDDAAAYSRYADILNFDSFLMSCYTLMQVVVISNWSIVMDAALEIFPVRGFVFFYFFKALMSLAIMPLMISLIIQTFITQLGIAELPSIRQKLKVFRISSSQQVTSSMVAMWSPNGREVVHSPSKDMKVEELSDLKKQITAKVAEVAAKKKFIVESLKGDAPLMQKLKNDDYFSEIALTADEIPAATFNLENVMQASALRVPAANLQWLETNIQLQDLRILLEMKEWAFLVTDASLRNIGTHERIMYNIIEKKYFVLERKYYADLAYLWFHDSIHARHIDLPKNKFSLNLYAIHRSGWFLSLCNLLVVLQIASTLFVSSPCPRGAESFPARGYLLLNVFAALNLLIALFYGTETATNLYLGGQGGNWTRLRFFCCLFVFIDTLAFLSATNSPQHRFLYSSAIFPLFWITRSNTFREVVMGLYRSLKNSSIVYNLLFAFLIIWSLLGFYLFQRYSTPLKHFETFPTTVLAVLHCFTAAPYALDALLPLFSISPVVVIYFLIITLSMEIVTVSLIVASSDMQFRRFAATNLKRRLSLRRDALLAIWALFAKNDRMSADDWQFLSQGMKADFEIDARSASIFFIFVTNNRRDGATKLEFFRLMALIHSRAVASVVIEGAAESSGDSGRQKASDLDMSKIYLPQILPGSQPPSPSRKTTIHIMINPKKTTLLTKETLMVWPLPFIKGVCQYISFTNAFVIGSLQCKLLDLLSLSVHILLIPQVMYISSYSADDASWVKFGWFLEFLFWVDMVIRIVALGELTFLRRESHVARAFINLFSFSLQLDLGYPYLGKDATALRLLILIQCFRLFLMFWFEQGASQISKIFKVAARCLFLLFSVIFFFTIYAQHSFCNFIEPELVTSQMYIQTSRGKELANDDSNAWVQFQNLLNFDTFLQSMFTLFQIAVLGSWSMIMDAAAKTDPSKAFGFFYPYRLIIILAVLPLLNGLVIRSYVLLMDQKDTNAVAASPDEHENVAGADEEDDATADLGDLVVNSDEQALSNRRVSLSGRRGSRILEARKKKTKLAAAAGGPSKEEVLGRAYRGLTVTVFPSSRTLPEDRMHVESTRIDRNSFLSFWATGSGQQSAGEHLLHSYETIHLSHENINAELGRLDEVIRLMSPVKNE